MWHGRFGAEKKVNKGKGCGMQGVFGKEEIVWHEWFWDMLRGYWGTGLKSLAMPKWQ